MKWLVTGAAGFIGSNFVHALYEDSQGTRPERVVSFDAMTYAADASNLAGMPESHSLNHADVRDSKAVAACIDELGPDIVVHFAAESHVDRSIADAGDFVSTNVGGTHVMLEQARRADVPLFVQISTDEVYGSVEQGFCDEDSALRPGNPYAASKAGADLLAQSYHRTYGIDVRITRCTNNYGPRQHGEKLIPKTIANALEGKSIPVYGSGRNVRDWIHVDDHAAAIRAVIEHGAPGQVYNIAGGNEQMNLDVVRQLIQMAGGSQDLIEMVNDRPGHDWRYGVDDRRLRGLGWAPQADWINGLRETVQWYRGRRGSA